METSNNNVNYHFIKCRHILVTVLGTLVIYSLFYLFIHLPTEYLLNLSEPRVILGLSIYGEESIGLLKEFESREGRQILIKLVLRTGRKK